MSSPESTAVMLIGLTARFGRFVSRKLQPDYEVIHFVSDSTLASEELKRILAGSQPVVCDDSGVSTGNFSHIPKHIILGKGFQLNTLEEVREAVGGTEAGLCWYWAPRKPGDLLIQPHELSNYSDETLDKMSSGVADAIKRALGQVIGDGKEGIDGIYTL